MILPTKILGDYCNSYNNLDVSGGKEVYQKETWNKFEGKNGYYHIAKVECEILLVTLTSILDHWF